MPLDIEAQLAQLVGQLRVRITPVETEEITEYDETLARHMPTLPLESLTYQPDRAQRSAWRPAVAAASVLFLLVGGLLPTDTRQDRNNAGVSAQPQVCTDSDYPVSFDGQLYPAVDTDLADMGFASADAAADSFLTDRTRDASLRGLTVTYRLLSEATTSEPNTIVKAVLRSGDSSGTVNIATRAVETTSAGTRWMVQAASSNVDDLEANIVDGSVVVDLDQLVAGTASVSVHDRFSLQLVDSASIDSEGADANAESIAPVRMILDSGDSPAPFVRYWFVGVNRVGFAELELHDGYRDHGEGWLVLERSQLC